MRTIIPGLLTIVLCACGGGGGSECDSVTLSSAYSRASTREELQTFICGGPIITLPDDIRAVVDANYDGLAHRGIDKITSVMVYGIDSNAYHFHALAANGKTVVYHHGHGGDFIGGKDTIAAFLDNGYDVIAFSMPLLGPNSGPFTSHNQLVDVENGLCLFAEPVIRALNYLDEDVYMAGLSGGGWTTVLLAAMDDRVVKSYPVAGSLPLDLYVGCGDWEQFQLPLVMPYRELYALAEHQLAIQNEFDPCCFWGRGLETLEIGENWSAVVDSTHREHKISEFAMALILEDMK